MCFDNVIPIEDIAKQLNLLERYITAKFNFYNRNLRLVLYIAKRGGNVLAFEDKIQEGCLGLIKAINYYKVSMGTRFSTYATNWIRQSSMRSVSNDGYIIRIPVHFREKIKKYNNFISTYLVNYGVEPTIEVCANELNLTKEQIIEIQKVSQDVVSLDVSVSTVEDGEDIVNFISDDTANVEENYLSKELIDFIRTEIESLSYRDKTVMLDRWGLNDDEIVYTLEEIGQKFSITRERVRQIEKREARKMRYKLRKNGFIIDNDFDSEASFY